MEAEIKPLLEFVQFLQRFFRAVRVTVTRKRLVHESRLRPVYEALDVVIVGEQLGNVGRRGQTPARNEDPTNRASTTDDTASMQPFAAHLNDANFVIANCKEPVHRRQGPFV